MTTDPGAFAHAFPEALRYEDFRQQVFSGATRVAEGGGGSSGPRGREMEVQAQWYGGEYGRLFTSVDGLPVEVVQFGHWNRGPGPDFVDVAVRIDGVLKRGALEVDMDVRDWERHGHAANPAFHDTVLHVFTDGPALNRFFTRTAAHREVCQVQLPQFAWAQGRPDFLPVAHPGRCVTPLAAMSDADVASLLSAAACHRLKEKARRLQVMARATSVDQAMFQAVAEALGYSRNALSMAVLAQRCPLRGLAPTSAHTRTQQGLVAEATLFGVAGFLEPLADQVSQPDGAPLHSRQLWEEWWKLRPDFEAVVPRRPQWDFAATRPANHPHRRVAALAAVAGDWKTLSKFWQQVVNNCEKNVNKWAKQLSHPFWEKHCTLVSPPGRLHLRLLGAERCRDLLGNVVYPGLAAHTAGAADSAWAQYQRLGRGATNHKLRRCLTRLFGEDNDRQKLFTSYYHQQQGLLQIYQDFCLEDASDCQHCPFPEQLLQWKTKEPPR